MQDIEFTRLNSLFFSFLYVIENITYSTGVLFRKPITDDEFLLQIPKIKENLNWLEKNINFLNSKIESYLPQDQIATFSETRLVSLSLLFENENTEPKINLAYGNDGVYLSVTVENHSVLAVELNE